jgi:hypothetical protein
MFIWATKIRRLAETCGLTPMNMSKLCDQYCVVGVLLHFVKAHFG